MTNQLDATRSSFIEENRQEFAELLTFIDFAEGLTIGFVEVNQEADKATLADALREAFKSSSIQLEVFNFSREQDLRFLREALIERVAQIRTDKKLVLFIQGLEAAIGNDRVGAYPPILQDLNFVRDSYRQSVPYPLLFVLPDYAITRVSLYAPDFWAWRSGVFTFKTSAESRKQLQTQAFEQPSSRVASSENQAQIEQLKQFLMELHPSGHPLVEQNVQLCREVYYKLGSAYLTQHQPEKARDYLHEGLKLTERYPDPVLTLSLYRKLGNAYEDMRQFEQAIDTYNRMLKIAQSVNREDWCSTALHDLGNVALEQRQFEQAKVFYHQSLAIAETLKNRYNQASTYPQLGRVAQKLREFEQARLYYQQALDIFIEFGDRYNQASTYHNLGIVAQELREYEQARLYYQQALDIFIEFGDRYNQASTYHQLGRVAQELREYEQARLYYQQALDIFIEFGDRFSQARTYYQLGKLSEALGELDEAKTYYSQDLQITIEFNDTAGLETTLSNLGRFYRTTQDASLLEAIAPILGTTATALQQAINTGDNPDSDREDATPHEPTPSPSQEEIEEM